MKSAIATRILSKYDLAWEKQIKFCKSKDELNPITADTFAVAFTDLENLENLESFEEWVFLSNR